MSLPTKAEVRSALIASGMAEKDVDEFYAWDAKMNDFIERRVCPTCGGALSRKVDDRQAGESIGEGLWVNYRCPCGFMMDRKEIA